MVDWSYFFFRNWFNFALSIIIACIGLGFALVNFGLGVACFRLRVVVLAKSFCLRFSLSYR